MAHRIKRTEMQEKSTFSRQSTAYMLEGRKIGAGGRLVDDGRVAAPFQSVKGGTNSPNFELAVQKAQSPQAGTSGL